MLKKLFRCSSSAEEGEERPGQDARVSVVTSEHKLPTNSSENGKTYLKLVHVSDTHMNLKHFMETNCVPEGDVFILTGDFSHKSEHKKHRKNGNSQCLKRLNTLLGTLPHRYKIVICGNHDYYHNRSIAEMKMLLNNAIYLQDDSVTIAGVKFYGTPWTGSSRMGYSASKEERAVYWANIPSDTDVLLSHMPPFNLLDLASNSRNYSDAICEICGKVHMFRKHWGDRILRQEVLERVKPVVHCYGHVHECHGKQQQGDTLFVNSALSDGDRRRGHVIILQIRA